MPEEQPQPESKNEIKVAVNGHFNLELQEVPTAGYEWAFEFATDKLKIVDSTFEPADDAVGSGGTRKITFRSLQAGEIALCAKLLRPWNEQDVAEVREYQVTSSADES